MSLDLTKYYSLSIPDSKKSKFLVKTDRDLSGSYRIDFDRSENLYIYNEDIGVSEWGLEISYPKSPTYEKIKDIYSACYGSIYDYRLDDTDGTSYMEYLREVRSVSGVYAYYLVVHCSDGAYDAYSPVNTVTATVKSLCEFIPHDENTGYQECDYEKIALSFAYSNPTPDIYKLYQLPLFSTDDWGKYLHINETTGALEWAGLDLAEILARLSQLSGIPPNSHPVIPYIIPTYPDVSPHTLFSATLPILSPSDETSVELSIVYSSSGLPDTISSVFKNCAWKYNDAENRIEYLVFDFPVTGLPAEGPIRISIGNCEFKYALSTSDTVDSDCILDSVSIGGDMSSNYIYTPGTPDLAWSDASIPYFGASGKIFMKTSRLSDEVSFVPFEIRLSVPNTRDPESVSN